MRRACRAAPAPLAAASRRSFFAPTACARQRQHDHVLSTVHGAGFTRHDGAPGGQFRPTKAPDLQHTDVHQGFGTGEGDPYTRTLPNFPLQPPETTVMALGEQPGSPTIDELRALGTRWAPLGYWINSGAYGRLPLYLEALLSPTAATYAFTPEMESLLDTMAERLPAIMEQYGAAQGKPEVLLSAIRTARAGLDALALELLLTDAMAFDTQVASVVAKVLDTVKAVGLSVPELALLGPALTARCGSMRNRRLTELAAFLRHPDTCNSSATWAAFFAATDQRFAELGLPSACQFVWTHKCRTARLPAMSAPVALYFALCCASLQPPSATTATSRARATAAPVMAKKAFLRQAIPDLMATLTHPQVLLTALRAGGASQEVCELITLHSLALAQGATADAAEAASAVNVFEDFASADFYLQQLMQNLNRAGTEATKQLLVTIFELNPKEAESIRGSVNGKLAKLRVVPDARAWAQLYPSIAGPLLAHGPTTELLAQLVSNDSRSGTYNVKVHEARGKHAAVLDGLLATRRSRFTAMRQRDQRIMEELADYPAIDATLTAMTTIGIPLAELEAAAAAAQQAAQSAPAAVALDSKAVAVLLAQIARQHPAWVTSHVFSLATPAHAIAAAGSADASRPAYPLAVLPNLVAMFIRLTWAPHAGEAMVKARTRRRIGPVGLDPTQHNIPVEVGMVESYDNLQHKRWDWQGWYQRMVDVHNRNVSLRCRADTLKQLDSSGKPFVDMQCERRLRVVAGERFGMGMLKLDSDRFEDQHDNLEFGLGKFSEVVADARKATLGEEYWPSVEVKVRRPSGQSKMRYSLVDDARLEAKSKELYQTYKQVKQKKVFVTPMDTWLDIAGLTKTKMGAVVSEEGYSIDSLQSTLEEGSAPAAGTDSDR